MAVNLVGQFGRGRAREILESSFAQFQADRAVVGLARQVRRNEEALEGYREAMTCHLGDFEEYAALRRALKDREAELARSGPPSAGPRRRGRSRRCGSATSSACRPGATPGWPVVLDPGIIRGRPTARARRC